MLPYSASGSARPVLTTPHLPLVMTWQSGGKGQGVGYVAELRAKVKDAHELRDIAEQAQRCIARSFKVRSRRRWGAEDARGVEAKMVQGDQDASLARGQSHSYQLERLRQEVGESRRQTPSSTTLPTL